jgi:hypothetical protein
LQATAPAVPVVLFTAYERFDAPPGVGRVVERLLSFGLEDLEAAVRQAVEGQVV